ncbi:ion transporter [Gammaproteobacteria bacterium]|nr:ion transporter [Gammaproteobacteria bacterium]
MTETLSLRHRVAQIIDPEGNSRINSVINITLMMAIFISLVSIIAESALTTEVLWLEIFRAIEYTTVALFGVEYLLRIWSCVDLESWQDKRPIRGRLRYAMQPMMLIDLLAILPLLLIWILPDELVLLRTLRLLRVFKLTRYSRSMQVLIEVLRSEAATFSASLFIMLILVVIAASGMHVVERQVQPEHFGSIPQAMWWALVTLTTVGYGDIVPITVAGKLFGALITIIGVGMVALPAGILASGFGEQLRRSRDQYSDAVDHALADGVIDDDEHQQLEQLREQLGLSQEEVKKLLRRSGNSAIRCPHCGKNVTDGKP